MLKRIFAMVLTVAVLSTLAMTVFALTVFASEEDSTVCTFEPAQETEAQMVLEIETTEPIQNEEPLVLETEAIENEPIETAPAYEEKYPEVPHYFQTDYPDVKYGTGSVATHGCGVTSLAMVLSYLLDEEILPDSLAEQYRSRYSGSYGSDWKLFPASAEDFGVTLEERTWNWEHAKAALENGQVVIANPQKNIFTRGGHIIVLYGITTDGKVLVRDPYKGNLESDNPVLMDGFANGFDQKYVQHCAQYWIYGAKDVDYIAEQSENLEY